MSDEQSLGYVVEPGNVYCRTKSTARTRLDREIVQYTSCPLNRSPNAAVVPSGMNSICGLLQAVLVGCSEEKAKFAPHFIFGDEMYCDLKRTITYFKKTNRFTYEFVDVRDKQKILQVFAAKTRTLRLFFIESCTNSSGQMFDFALWENLKAIAPKCLFAVDNTWLTCDLFNPLQYGANVVIESMTKYVSASKCIGGLIAGEDSFMKKVSMWIRVNGLYINPDQCEIYSEGLNTMQGRISQSGQITSAVAEFLEKHPKVNRVMYPLLASHPTYQVNKKYLEDIGPSVLLFHVGRAFKSRKLMMQYFESSGLCAETSYGSSYSKLDPYSTSGKHNCHEYPSRSEGSGKSGLWIRLAVGYESSLDELTASLNRLLG